MIMDNCHSLPVNTRPQMEISEPLKTPRRTSTAFHRSKRSTLRTSFAPMTTKHTRQPIDFKGSAVTPVHPLGVGGGTVHVMSAKPLKPMTSSNSDVIEPGCICCSHETVIQEVASPDQPITPPSIAQPVCADCCQCTCANCTRYHCKPSEHSPCRCGGECSNCDVTHCSPSVCDVSCAQDTTEGEGEECTRRMPPCITKCNNNYLGNDLPYGGLEGKPPTTRTLSTTQLAPMKIEFTGTTAHADVDYNPIQPMPTIASMNPDDIILHHIIVAQPILQSLQVTPGPNDYILVAKPNLK